MKQLGVIDAAFINLEQTNTPQHVGSMGIYDPSTAPDGFVRFKQVIANFESRLKAHPIFRTRLVEVPGNFDRPYWVVDSHFDVEFHLRHIALPQPGDWRQLCIQVARLHSRPLDMSRPLWEAYIIEGLDNISDLPEGSFAIYTKIHHSLVDGVGGAQFMAAFHDLEPDPAPYETPKEPIIVEREPSSSELIGRGVVNQGKSTVSMASGAVNLVKDLTKLGLAVRRNEVPMPDIQSPKTRFNEPVGTHRVFAGEPFSLADIKMIKNAMGVTVNDVALGIVGGAMRSYLDAKGELPEESLVSGVPMNMRGRRDSSGENNQVGSVFCELHTNIADPVERLQAIHKGAAEAKNFGEKSPLVDAIKIAGAVPPLVAKTAASIWSRRNLGALLPVGINTVVSNVPGPNFDVYCSGARLVRYHGLGVLTPSVGIFHAVFSMGGTLTISVLADRDQLPDPDVYMSCLKSSFAELKALAEKALAEQAKAEEKASKAAAKAGAQAKKAPAKKKATAKKAAAQSAKQAKSAKPAKKKVAAKAVTAKKSAKKAAASKRPKSVVRRKAGAVKPAATKATG